MTKKPVTRRMARGTGGVTPLSEPFPIVLEIDDSDIVYERVVEPVVECAVDDVDIVEEDVVEEALALSETDVLVDDDGIPAEGDFVIAMSDMFADRNLFADAPIDSDDLADHGDILEAPPPPVRMTSIPPRFTTTTPGVMRRQPR